MEKRKIILITIGIIIILLGNIYLSTLQITGETIKENKKQFTMAICNKTEDKGIYCEDYEIYCERGEISKINPTGNAIYQESGWEDPRGEDGSLITCK